MPFVPPHNAGDVGDGKMPARSDPVSHVTTVTGPSSFAFGGYTWQTHAWNAPPVGNKNGNFGKFVKANVSIGSELVLTLKQTGSGSQILSNGAEVGTVTSNAAPSSLPLGYNVASGSVASGFLYQTNSITEIDMEQVGNKATAVIAPTGRDLQTSGTPRSRDTIKQIPTISRSYGAPPTLTGTWTASSWSTTPGPCLVPPCPSSSTSGEPTHRPGGARPPRE